MNVRSRPGRNDGDFWIFPPTGSEAADVSHGAISAVEPVIGRLLNLEDGGVQGPLCFICAGLYGTSLGEAVGLGALGVPF